MTDRESIVESMERDLRHSVKILKANHRIERDRRGWVDRFDLMRRNQNGVLYADFLTGRRFDKALRPFKALHLGGGWWLQLRFSLLRPARVVGESIRLYQFGPFVLYGPGSAP